MVIGLLAILGDLLFIGGSLFSFIMVAILVIFYAIIFAIMRCPACGKYLGWGWGFWGRRFCRKCQTQIRP